MYILMPYDIYVDVLPPLYLRSRNGCGRWCPRAREPDNHPHSNLQAFESEQKVPCINIC